MWYNCTTSWGKFWSTHVRWAGFIRWSQKMGVCRSAPAHLEFLIKAAEEEFYFLLFFIISCFKSFPAEANVAGAKLLYIFTGYTTGAAAVCESRRIKEDRSTIKAAWWRWLDRIKGPMWMIWCHPVVPSCHKTLINSQLTRRSLALFLWGDPVAISALWHNFVNTRFLWCGSFHRCCGSCRRCCGWPILRKQATKDDHNDEKYPDCCNEVTLALPKRYLWRLCRHQPFFVIDIKLNHACWIVCGHLLPLWSPGSRVLKLYLCLVNWQVKKT